MLNPYSRLQALGLVLPAPPRPLANYVAYAEVGAMLYVSGQGPRDADGNTAKGKVGRDLDIAQAYQQARLTGLNLLAVMHAALGDLGRVRRVVKLFGKSGYQMWMPVDHRVDRITQPVLIKPTAQSDIQLHRVNVVAATLSGAGVKEQAPLQRCQRQYVSDPHTAARARRSAAGSARRA